jgi:hypothetical protein
VSAGYILIACGLVGLAIAYNLWARPHLNPRTWVTRELYRGDLRALSGAARGYAYDVDIKQADRLRARIPGKRSLGPAASDIEGPLCPAAARHDRARQVGRRDGLIFAVPDYLLRAPVARQFAAR